jgi:hypothetical protein
MSWYSVALFALIAGTGSAGSAEENLLVRPQFCAHALTVQQHGCEMQKIFRCSRDGHTLFRSERFDQFGLVDIFHADTNGDPLGLTSFDGTYGIEFDNDAPSPESVVRMLAKRSDGFDLTATLNFRGITRPIKLVGSFQFDQEDTVISGLEFQRVLSVETLVLPSPMPTVEGSTMRYYSDALNIVFHGEGTYPLFFGEEGDDVSKTPATVILPEQPGFDAEQPQFDCGQIGLIPAISFNQGDVG